MAEIVQPVKLPHYCSFCGKSHDEVTVMLTGPTANICDECVGLAQAIIDERRAAKAGQSPTEALP